jgi:uncharacterized protein (DUF169 family)
MKRVYRIRRKYFIYQFIALLSKNTTPNHKIFTICQIIMKSRMKQQIIMRLAQ